MLIRCFHCFIDCSLQLYAVGTHYSQFTEEQYYRVICEKVYAIQSRPF